MHGRHLHATLALRNVAEDCCSLRQIRRGKTRERRCVTERIRAVLQRDEAEPLCCVKPFHGGPLRSRTGAEASIVIVYHSKTAAPLCRDNTPCAEKATSGPYFAPEKA